MHHFMFKHSSHTRYLTNVPFIVNNLFHCPTNPIQNAMESLYNEFPLCVHSIHWILIYYKTFMVMNTQGCMMLFKLIFHVVGEQLHVNFVFPHIRLIVLILSSLKRWFSHLCQEHVTNLALNLQPKPIITSAMIWKDVLKLKHISINVKKCKVVSSNIPKGIPNLGIKNFKMS